MVGLSARSGDIAPGAIVGIIGRQIVRTKGRDAYDVVIGAGIVSVAIGLVAGGENCYITICNDTVVTLAGLEIMNCIYLQGALLVKSIVGCKGNPIAIITGNN